MITPFVRVQGTSRLPLSAPCPRTRLPTLTARRSAACCSRAHLLTSRSRRRRCTSASRAATSASPPKQQCTCTQWSSSTLTACWAASLPTRHRTLPQCRAGSMTSCGQRQRRSGRHARGRRQCMGTCDDQGTRVGGDWMSMHSTSYILKEHATACLQHWRSGAATRAQAGSIRHHLCAYCYSCKGASTFLTCCL
jgi:hypothetical protein